MEGSWPSQGISRRGGLPTSCSGAPEYWKESSISSIFAVGTGHGGALASSSTFLWLSMNLVTGHMHILWGLLLKNAHEVTNEKLSPRPWRGQQVTTWSPSGFGFCVNLSPQLLREWCCETNQEKTVVVSSLLKYKFLTSLLAVLREEWKWGKFREQKNKKGTDAFLLFLWLKN